MEDKNGYSRNLQLDILKSFAIALVVWGHVIQFSSTGAFDFYENQVFQFIYSFHMPLFMEISGYLFWKSLNKRSLSQIFLKQYKSIIVPIIVWTVIYVFLDYCKGYLNLDLFGELIDYIYQRFFSLWYLWSLIFASLATALIYKKIDNPIIRIICYMAFWLCLFLMPGKYILYKGCHLWMFPYFLSGFYFHKYETEIQRKMNKYHWICIPVFFIMLYFFGREHFIYTSGINPFDSKYGFYEQIIIDIYRWIIGFAGIGMMTFAVKKIVKIRKLSCISNIFKRLSNAALYIYMLQPIMISYFYIKYYNYYVNEMNGGVNKLTSNVFLFNYLWTPLISVIFLSILYLISEVILYIKKMLKVRENK